MKWLPRFIMQFSLMPPININITIPRRWRPPVNVDIPKKPAAFDPARKVSNREARIYAASNSLEETRK